MKYLVIILLLLNIVVEVFPLYKAYRTGYTEGIKETTKLFADLNRGENYEYQDSQSQQPSKEIRRR